MTSTVSVIGLGEIGSSIAMALKAEENTFTVIGNDFERSAEKTAEENHWVDRTEHNLFDAVSDAQTVILAIPADQVRKTLELLGDGLREDAVILDFCPAKKSAAAWARQFLKHPDRFLGVWAGISPQYLGEPGSGGDSARPDLFKGAMLFAAAAKDTSDDAIRLAEGLANLLEMECSFTDPAELDGLIAAVYQFPLLAANGLLSCLNKRPGWKDGKKAAGKLFYTMTSPVAMQTDRTEPGTALLENRENTVRILNDYIAELVSYRNALQSRDETTLRSLIEENQKNREQWEMDYRKPSHAAEMPAGTLNINASEMIQQVFFGGFLRKKNRD